MSPTGAMLLRRTGQAKRWQRGEISGEISRDAGEAPRERPVLKWLGRGMLHARATARSGVVFVGNRHAGELACRVVGGPDPKRLAQTPQITGSRPARAALPTLK